MCETKKTEIENQLELATFKTTLMEDIPSDGSVLPGQFVPTINSIHDGQVKRKARYVVGGHRDVLKNMRVHSKSMLQPQSVRMLLALSMLSEFDLWTSNVRQAYLQSPEPLGRDMFICNLVRELKLGPCQGLQVLKLLYDLYKSVELRQTALENHHLLDVGLTTIRSNSALHVSK